MLLESCQFKPLKKLTFPKARGTLCLSFIQIEAGGLSCPLFSQSWQTSSRWHQILLPCSHEMMPCAHGPHPGGFHIPIPSTNLTVQRRYMSVLTRACCSFPAQAKIQAEAKNTELLGGSQECVTEVWCFN